MSVTEIERSPLQPCPCPAIARRLDCARLHWAELLRNRHQFAAAPPAVSGPGRARVIWPRTSTASVNWPADALMNSPVYPTSTNPFYTFAARAASTRTGSSFIRPTAKWNALASAEFGIHCMSRRGWCARLARAPVPPIVKVHIPVPLHASRIRPDVPDIRHRHVGHADRPLRRRTAPRTVFLPGMHEPGHGRRS